jgi:hypothetical protein
MLAEMGHSDSWAAFVMLLLPPSESYQIFEAPEPSVAPAAIAGICEVGGYYKRNNRECGDGVVKRLVVWNVTWRRKPAVLPDDRHARFPFFYKRMGVVVC